MKLHKRWYRIAQVDLLSLLDEKDFTFLRHQDFLVKARSRDGWYRARDYYVWLLKGISYKNLRQDLPKLVKHLRAMEALKQVEFE